MGSRRRHRAGLAAFGSREQKDAWLAAAATGDAILTTALAEERSHAPLEPTTRAELEGDGWTLSGTKVVVPAGTMAGLFVVPATTPQGLTVFLVRPDDEGVIVTAQQITGGETAAGLALDGVVGATGFSARPEKAVSSPSGSPSG